MNVNTKDAKTSKNKNSNGALNQEKAEQVKTKINQVAKRTATERLERLEALNGLKVKFEKVKDAENKLEKFNASNHKGDFVLNLSGESGENFKTNNFLITSKVIGLIKEGVEELKSSVNQEILAFDI